MTVLRCKSCGKCRNFDIFCILLVALLVVLLFFLMVVHFVEMDIVLCRICTLWYVSNVNGAITVFEE